MGKHQESQTKVEALKILDYIATPGVAGIVLAKGKVIDADESTYAGITLLHTIEGNDFHPFRTARFYFDDDLGTWQSGSGQSFMSLTSAIEDFRFMTGEAP